MTNVADWCLWLASNILQIIININIISYCSKIIGIVILCNIIIIMIILILVIVVIVIIVIIVVVVTVVIVVIIVIIVNIVIIVSWTSSNRLRINPDKTEAIWFGSPAGCSRIGSPTLQLTGLTSFLRRKSEAWECIWIHPWRWVLPLVGLPQAEMSSFVSSRRLNHLCHIKFSCPS